MSSAKRRKRVPSTVDRNIAISIEISKNPTSSIQGIYDAIHRFAQEMGPVVQQSIKLGSIQDSLINQADLFSPGFDRILGEQLKNYDFQRIFSSPINDLLGSANLSLGKMFEFSFASDTNQRIQEIMDQSNPWKIPVDELQKTLKITEPYSVMLQSHLADIGKYSALSQAFLSNIPYVDIGNAIKVDDSLIDLLKDSFLDLSKSYSNLFNWLEVKPLELLTVPPTLSKLPAIEFFNGVNTLGSVTINSQPDINLAEEKKRTDKLIMAETEDKLDSLLARINPDYLIPLHGARESIKSTNPDRTRHLSSSLRELFTQILHLLSPDDEIKAWNNSREYFDKGKPTRRARLLFICQSINQEPFHQFVESDIEATLAFLDLFQRGTHEVAAEYTDEQLRAMLIRMESLLRYLLEIKAI